MIEDTSAGSPGQPAARPSEGTAPTAGTTQGTKLENNTLHDSILNIIGNISLNQGEWQPARRKPLVDIDSSDRCAALTDGWSLDFDLLSRIGDVLGQHRFVLLTGRGELGKGCIAFAAAGQMAERSGLHPLPIYRVRDLTADHPFDPMKPDLGADLGFKDGGVVIVKDAIEADNLDLLRLLKKLDSQALTSLTETLARANLFLVLTVDDDQVDAKLPVAAARLGGLGVRLEIPLPTTSELASTWERMMPSFAAAWPSWVVPHPPAGDTLAVLQTHPRVVRFFETWLSVSSGQSEPLPPYQVLAQLDDARAWIDAVRSGPNRSVWHAMLALLLGLSVSSRPYVPWSEFLDLLDEVDATLTPPSDTPAARINRMPDPDSFRARVYKEAGPLPSTLVTFKDLNDGARLWDALIKHDPVVASRLLDHFLGVAAGMTGRAGSVEFRRLAARAAGKLGVHEPNKVLKQAQAWLSGDDAHMVLLGELAQGVISTGDVALRTLLLDLLRAQRTEAVLVPLLLYTLPVLSFSDFEGATSIFRTIVTRSLRKDASDLAALNKTIRMSRLAEATFAQAGAAVLQGIFQEFQRDLTSSYLQYNGENFPSAVAGCLTFLCLFGGGVEVMHDLFARTDRGLHPLLTGLFVGPGGVAHRAAAAAESLGGSYGDRLQDPFLLSLRSAAGTVEQMKDIILCLDATIEFFPRGMRSVLRRQILALLLHWMRNSIADAHVARNLAVVFRKIIMRKESTLAAELEGEITLVARKPETPSRLRKLAAQALI